jgi:hypothetical protein
MWKTDARVLRKRIDAALRRLDKAGKRELALDVWATWHVRYIKYRLQADKGQRSDATQLARLQHRPQ